jgi:hypothetical protein
MSAHEHDDDQPDSFDVIERLRARVAKLEEALKMTRDKLHIVNGRSPEIGIADAALKDKP